MSSCLVHGVMLCLITLASSPLAATQESGPPPFRQSDLATESRLAAYVDRFLSNDRLARELLNPSNLMLYSEGYRPEIGVPNDPEGRGEPFRDLRRYFVRKLYLDLHSISPFTQQQFERFVDRVGAAADTTIICAGRIAVRHDLSLEGSFNFQTEVRKIPPGPERETFKRCWLNDAVLGTELRILAWVYQELYAVPYVPPERRP